LAQNIFGHKKHPMIKKIAVFIFCTTLTTITFARQNRGMGEVFDLELLSRTPQKIQMSERSFRDMPSSYSLEKYAPTPGDQGNYGTCTAWAVGYGAATILYARTHNITDKALINKYAFSPTFLYEQIKQPTDKDCQGGSSSLAALSALIEKGDATLKTAPYGCNIAPSEHAKTEAQNYKLADAALLFTQKGISKNDVYYKEPQAAIELTKKALLEGSPVSISFLLPKSFFAIKSAVWNPDPQESFGDWKHNNHAMCVIAYDDNIAGGAFKILNSWGTAWGDKGMVWIKYDDFARWCQMALQPFASPFTKAPEENPVPSPEPLPNPKPIPQPKPAPVAIITLSGSMEFKQNTGEDMPVTRISSRNLVVEDEKSAKEDLVAYTMIGSYASGTRFRFYLNIDQEAYIYAFATDLSGKINKILPFDDLVSTHVGASTVVAFPSDTKVIKLDDNKGTDYLLVLYSKEKLDMDGLISSMNATKGGLSAKIISALGNKLISKNKIRYDGNKVGFSVNVKPGTRNLTVENDTKTNQEPATGSVVPLMIEIKHN
jgi:hypothetical protein